jgi:ABC-type Na+ efflux pump permease subunit
MQEFLMGATAMGCWVAMLFFLRFWRETGDRLFGMFSAAFLLLGMTRFGLALAHEPSEGETYLYWVRLAAYLLILVAIVNKNRN